MKVAPDLYGAPWGFLAEPGHPVIVHSDVEGSNFPEVCEVFVGLGMTDQEVMARVRLITAAPLLLEKLTAWAAVCERITDQYGGVVAGVDFGALGRATSAAITTASPVVVAQAAPRRSILDVVAPPVPPLDFNQLGHVCPQTGRVAITVAEACNRPDPDSPLYLYLPRQAEAGMDPWRVIEGVDGRTDPGDYFDLWMESGSSPRLSAGSACVYIGKKEAAARAAAAASITPTAPESTRP